MKQVEINYNDKGVCLVTPGDVVVSKGDEINFNNLTGAEIIFQFFESELDLFESAFPGKLGKDGQWNSKIKKGERGIYPYSVFCERNHDFAIGGSMPIIIIKR